MGVQISLQYSVFISFGFIPWSGIAGSHDSSIFNFLRNLHIFSHSTSTNLFPPTAHRVSFSPHFHQQLLSPVFLIIAILTGVKWNLTVVLICIPPMISNVTHFFMYCWPLYVLLWKNVCSVPPPVFKSIRFSEFCFILVWFLAFCSWVVWVLYIFCILTLYWIYDLQILSPILQVVFSFCDDILCCAEVFSLMYSYWLIFAFVALLLLSNTKNHCQDQSQAYALCFLLGVLWF